MDIFHIIMLYLCYFYLILHVWWLLVIWLPQPEISWKNTIKILYFCIANFFAKFRDHYFAGWQEKPEKGPPGGPGSPPVLPFRVYDLSDLKIIGYDSKKYSAAASRTETTEREKALRQGEICWGNSFLEKEDRRHRHRQRHELHRDHHQHHPHRQHHHPHSSTPFRCFI